MTMNFIFTRGKKKRGKRNEIIKDLNTTFYIRTYEHSHVLIFI